jgi:ABC-type lipoprotein export system ATPase subunit
MLIQCERLSLRYRARGGTPAEDALKEVDLRAAAGEFVVIKGPSGCGKTTLLLVLGGMLRPTAGRVEVAGMDLGGMDAAQRARFRAREIGFVFQMFHLAPYLTVLENVLLARWPDGGGRDPGPPGPREGAQGGVTPPSNAGAHARNASPSAPGPVELLQSLGLGGRLRHKPDALSAGERQRTALARALVRRPRLILADEPTGNLDPEHAADVFDHLRDYQRRAPHGAVIVATHGSQADAYASRILQLRDGRIL